MSAAGCSAEVLDAISKVCDNVLDCNDPEFGSEQHIETLDRLERRLKYATQYIEDGNAPDQTQQDERAVRIAELYRLAGLIYLYRGAQRLPPGSSKVKTVVNAAFETAARLEACDRAFPIFIIGCEARFDEERLQMLDLVRKTQASGTVGNIAQAQQLMEAVWRQDDLDTENEMDYVKVLEAVISMSRELPSFV